MKKIGIVTTKPSGPKDLKVLSIFKNNDIVYGKLSNKSRLEKRRERV